MSGLPSPSSQPLTPSITALSSCPCSPAPVCLCHVCHSTSPLHSVSVWPVAAHSYSSVNSQLKYLLRDAFPHLSGASGSGLSASIALSAYSSHCNCGFYVSGLSDLFYSSLSWQSPSIMPAIEWMRKRSTYCVRHWGDSNRGTGRSLAQELS